MAYSTSRPPSPELCDNCKLPLNHNGIFENVNSFLKRIEKGADILISEDLDDDENNVVKDTEEQPEVEKAQDISSRLAIQIEQIESW
ncbi:hypothetical protein C2G38_2192915 [Gigaspora rosea]|uniref:Uncharacterized protein n=1 Tax=Gigaspora rosea TaxID=44941 RepID=A0A397V1D4_9GLOM|nr:hypothetical protein C2G38_2192915 [Gigaspora rosea]